MASQNDLLVQRRRAAMQARNKPTPVVEEAEVPVVAPPIEPLKPPPPAVDEGDDDPGYKADDAQPVTGIVAPIRSPRNISLPTTPMVDPTRTIEQSDQIMAKLKISQAMSKVNADDIVRQGNWYHTTLNEDLGKTVLVVPVDMRKSRSYFVQGQGVMCRSFDLIKGEGQPGLLCEGDEEEKLTLPADHRGCPLRLWGEKDPSSGRSAPPKCGINYNYPLLILDPDDMANGPTRRALLSLRGTATKTARAINTIVSENDLLWHEVVLELGLQSQTNAKGTFYVPTVRFVGTTTGSVRERAERFAAQVNAAAIRATIEAGEDDE